MLIRIKYKPQVKNKQTVPQIQVAYSNKDISHRYELKVVWESMLYFFPRIQTSEAFMHNIALRNVILRASGCF